MRATSDQGVWARSGAVGEGGTPLSKAGGLGRAQGKRLTHTRCQSLLTGPEIPHSQQCLSPALFPGLAGAVRQGLLPELRERAVPHLCSAVRLCTRQRICSPRQRWLDGARLPHSTSGLPPCSHRPNSPLRAIPQGAAV